MSKFKYKERSAETVSARSKQSGGNYDSYLNTGLNFLKVKEGQNDLRILPPTWDVEGPFGDNWGIEVFVHRDIGPDKGTYLCLDKMREKYGAKTVPSKLGECPLCAARHEVADDDADALKALKPGKQILAYVINRDDEKAGPQVWRLGWQLERDIQIRSQDKKSGAVIPLDHPDRGYDISFTREGAGLKTKYVGVDIARDESPLSDREVRQEKWLQFIQDNPLNEQFIFHDADYLEQVYMGKKGGKGADEEEDDRPTRTKRPARDEDEEEERPRARRTEEDEEEEAPRRRRPAADEEDDDRMPTDAEMKRNSERSRKPAADEDEEDAPPRRKRPAAEEEDDEPAPRRKRPAAEEEEDEAPPTRRKPRDEEEEDEPAPRRRRPADDEDEEERPRARKPADEEEDEAPVRRRRPAAEEEEEEPAPRRKKPAADEDEEDAPKPKGKAVDRAKESLGRLKPKGK